MPNEVVIHVKAKNDTKATFGQVRRDAQKAGDEIGSDLTEHISEKVEKDAKSDKGGGFAKAGDSIGEKLGKAASEKMSSTLAEGMSNATISDWLGGKTPSAGHNVPNGPSGGGKKNNIIPDDFDKNSGTILGKLKAFGSKASSYFNSGFADGIKSFFSSDITTKLIIGGLAIGLLPALTAFIGGALSSTLLLALGSAGIGAGIAAAFKDPKVKTAFKDFQEDAGKIFRDFGKPFVQPVADFFVGLGDLLDKLKPKFTELGNVLGPLTDKVGDGILGFLEKNLPAITDAIEAASPIVETLANHLSGGLADAFESFFGSLEDAGPDARVFFEDLLGAVEIAIKGLGKFIEAGAHLWVAIRPAVQEMTRKFMDAMLFVAEAAVRAFGWVPGLGDKLAEARNGIAKFRKQVNDELDKINRNINITVRTHYTDPKTGRGWSSGQGQSRDNGKASGGITGSGLTWVGEYGPELLNMPAGSAVRSAGDSKRLASAGGGGRGGGPMVVNLVLDGRTLATAMLDPFRDLSDNFGGSTQAMLGRA